MPAATESLTENEEKFAQAIAGGQRGVDAYSKLHPRASRKTATEKASRLLKRGNVKARVEFWTQEANAIVKAATEQATQEAKKPHIAKAKHALLTIARKYQILAEIAETGTNKEKMTAIHLDSELRGELILHQDLTTNGEALPTAMPQISLNMPQSFVNRRGTALDN